MSSFSSQISKFELFCAMKLHLQFVTFCVAAPYSVMVEY